MVSMGLSLTFRQRSLTLRKTVRFSMQLRTQQKGANNIGYRPFLGIPSSGAFVCSRINNVSCNIFAQNGVRFKKNA